MTRATRGGIRATHGIGTRRLVWLMNVLRHTRGRAIRHITTLLPLAATLSGVVSTTCRRYESRINIGSIITWYVCHWSSHAGGRHYYTQSENSVGVASLATVGDKCDVSTATRRFRHAGWFVWSLLWQIRDHIGVVGDTGLMATFCWRIVDVIMFVCRAVMSAPHLSYGITLRLVN